MSAAFTIRARVFQTPTPTTLSTGEQFISIGDAGQINGFDWYRLSTFAGTRLTSEFGIRDNDELRSIFDDACNSGNLIDSGYILWYTSDTE